MITRFSEPDRVAKETVGVRYVFGPKERVMADIVNGAQNITVPAVAVNVTNIARDSKRVFNKNNGFYLNRTRAGDPSIAPVRTPQPVKISVDLTVMTKYQADLEQIGSNFIPYFRPYIILTTQVPNTINPQDDIEVRTKVIWDENFRISTPTNLTYSEKFARVGETTFEIETWIYAEEEELVKPIYFIDSNFYAVKGKILDLTYTELSSGSYSLSSYPNSVQHTDQISISAHPQLTNWFIDDDDIIPIDGPISITSNSNRKFLFYGKNFNLLSHVLLSSNNTSLYTNLTTLSTAYYGSLSGFVIDDSFVSVLNNNILEVIVPALTGTGDMSIIVANQVGWSTSYNINEINIDII